MSKSTVLKEGGNREMNEVRDAHENRVLCGCQRERMQESTEGRGEKWVVWRRKIGREGVG